MATDAIIIFLNWLSFGGPSCITAQNVVKISRSIPEILYFLIFKMAVEAILDFGIHEILLTHGIQSAETRHCAKFRQNRSIDCEDIKIFGFFKMSAVRHRGYLGYVWTTHEEYLMVSITIQNLVTINILVIENMKISIFGANGWKTPINVPKIWVLWLFDPLNWVQHGRNHKRHIRVV